MNKLPLVSIVTPSLNQQQFLEETILSVINQDYPNIEYIIIDGGSTDGTLDIIHQYEDYLAYWTSEKDGGTSEAINKGWRQATGDYLWILNSDDLLVVPNGISLLVEYLGESPSIDFAYGNLYFMNENGEVVGERWFPDYTLLKLVLEDRKQAPFTGCLMRRPVLDNIGYFDTSLKSANDRDYLFRIALYHKMGHLHQFTGYFRVHPMASTQINAWLNGQEAVSVHKKLLQSPDAPPELLRQANQVLGIAHRYAVSCYIRNGHSQKTRYHIIQTYKYIPRKLFDPRLLVIFLSSLLGDRLMTLIRSLFLRIFPLDYNS